MGGRWRLILDFAERRVVCVVFLKLKWLFVCWRWCRWNVVVGNGGESHGHGQRRAHDELLHRGLGAAVQSRRRGQDASPG
jgi:hypothetical protein